MESKQRELESFVADTHALFWYLTASPRLGAQARQVLDAAAEGRVIVYVPAIVIAELYFLNEKARHPLKFSAEFRELRDSRQFVFVPFTAEDVVDFEQDSSANEMHDRIIVGVARRLGATCLTIDREITTSGLVKTAW